MDLIAAKLRHLISHESHKSHEMQMLADVPVGECLATIFMPALNAPAGRSV
jgi:hypothetical protein